MIFFGVCGDLKNTKARNDFRAYKHQYRVLLSNFL